MHNDCIVENRFSLTVSTLRINMPLLSISCLITCLSLEVFQSGDKIEFEGKKIAAALTRLWPYTLFHIDAGIDINIQY